MSFQGASQIIDTTFDGHKIDQQTTTVNVTGTATNLTVRFTSLTRVTFPLSVLTSNTASTAATVQTGVSYIGKTQTDYNVLGLTLIAAAGNTVAIQVLAYGI